MLVALGVGASMAQSMVPVFNGEHYDTWKIKMRTLLLSQGLWDIIEEGYIEPQELTESEKTKLQKNRIKDARTE